MELYHPLYGDQDLKPMTRDTYELTFGFKLLLRFTSEICGFYSKPKNYIQTTVTDSGVVKKDCAAPNYPAYLLPEDLPMPGINFFLEMRYTF